MIADERRSGLVGSKESAAALPAAVRALEALTRSSEASGRCSFTVHLACVRSPLTWYAFVHPFTAPNVRGQREPQHQWIGQDSNLDQSVRSAP